jgi:hypothetical protein
MKWIVSLLVRLPAWLIVWGVAMRSPELVQAGLNAIPEIAKLLVRLSNDES